MGQHRLFKRCQLRSLSVIRFAFLENDELHNLPMRFEILSVGSILRFQLQSHSDFRGAIISARRSTLRCFAVYLTRLAPRHFIPSAQEKDSAGDQIISRTSNEATHNSKGI